MYITEDTADIYVDMANEKKQLNANMANSLRIPIKYEYEDSDGTHEEWYEDELINKGSANKPVYFLNGVPEECDTISNSTTGNAATATKVNINDDTSSKLYVLGATNIGYQNIYKENDVYIQDDVLYGAAWNDYAEYRETKEKIQAGHVVVETGNGDLKLSSKRLEPGANIVSDTFGFAIGQTEICDTPIAVCGRVLAYPYEDISKFAPGDPVCAGPNGTISLMSRTEVQEYPDRMIGTVSEIPTYEYWKDGAIKVDGRIWIKVL